MAKSQPGLTIATATTLKELKTISEIDDKTLRELRSKPCTTVFDSMKRIFNLAQENSRKGDKLNAYVYYFRAATLCSIIQKSSGKDNFTHGINGKDFAKMFEIILEDLDKLTGEVEGILTDRQMANDLANSVVIEEKKQEKGKVKVVDDDPVVNGMISPKDVVAYGKKGKRILILDYRIQSEILIDFKGKTDGENIVIAQCPPSFIEESITIYQLAKILPIKERQKVDKIENYDLVVFMDDDNPRRDASGQLLPPANYLMKGLTVYAYNRKLKRDPVFMKGGFTMWRHTYTIYTNQDFQQSAFNDDDDFGKYLNEYRRSSSVTVDYPVLNDSREPPWPTSTGQQSQKELITDVKWRQNPLPDALPLSLPKPSSPVQNIPNPQLSPSKSTGSITTTSFSDTPDAPPVTRQIPTVDRSTKPSSQNPPNLPPPKVNQKPISPVESHVAQPPNIPPRPPQPQANGYPRTDPTNQIGFEHTPHYINREGDVGRNGTKESSVPPRPPIPDRSLKLTSQDKGRLIEVYERAKMKLLDNVKRGRPEFGVGFVNMGNTCFMNTTLQALMNTPGLSQIFTRDKFYKLVNIHNKAGTEGVISAVFSALVDIYWSGEVSVIWPDMFLKTFADYVNRSLADKRQHDAQEFQIYLMDALHEDTNQVYSRQGFQQDYDGNNLKKYGEDYEKKQKLFSFSLVADLFNIRTVSIIKCVFCGMSSATFEEMSQISLELEDNSFQELKYSLKNHFRRERLDNDCKWNCPKCRQPREAIRETFIWKLPNNLVIHFKRFSQFGSTYVKNESNVTFEIDTLSLDEFVHPEARGSNIRYSLYAITNHSGSLNSGHYTSIVKRGSRWFKYDDDYVSEVSRESIMNNKAFVLFYTCR